MQFQAYGVRSGLIGPPGPPPGPQSRWMREREYVRRVLREIYRLPLPVLARRRLRALWIRDHVQLVQRVQDGRRLYRR